MRVISGKYKGRTLKGDKIKGTRPTMDKIKESLFAMIQSKVENSICLDLFAGLVLLAKKQLVRCFFLLFH